MDGHIEHISSSNVGWAGAKGFWMVGRDIFSFSWRLRLNQVLVEPSCRSVGSCELFWRLRLDQVLVSPAVAKRHKLGGPAAVRARL